MNMTTMNPSIEWLRQKAAVEDESLVSVGGLVSRLEEQVRVTPATEAAAREAATSRSNPSLEWLRQKAAIEDESLVSVGGLVSQLEESANTTSAAKTADRQKPVSSSNSSVEWLRRKAEIEDENLTSVGGLPSRLQGLAQSIETEASRNLPWHETRHFAELRLSYLKQLDTWLSASESILPEQRCDLRRTFIMPTVMGLSGGSTTAALVSALVQQPRVFLVGEPGAGKTCFLRFLALDAVHHFKCGLADSLPVYLSLRDWA
jgi:hypothetical protein